MYTLLNWFTLEDSLEILVLIFLLLLVAGKLTRQDATVIKLCRWLSALTFVAYTVMGIRAWGLTGVTDLLIIVMRACLAAGTVFAVMMLVLGVVTALIGNLLAAVKRWFQRVKLQAEYKTRRRFAEKEQLESQRRDQLEQKRRRKQMQIERERQAEEANRVKQDRESRTDEARAEVIRFYEQHAAEIADDMPDSLFRTKLQTNFPDGIAPLDAWNTAQTMISEMLPLIAAASERRRAQLDLNKELSLELQKKRLEIGREESELEQLCRSPTFDADVCEPEIKVREERIRELKTELDLLEMQSQE